MHPKAVAAYEGDGARTMAFCALGVGMSTLPMTMTTLIAPMPPAHALVRARSQTRFAGAAQRTEQAPTIEIRAGVLLAGMDGTAGCRTGGYDTRRLMMRVVQSDRQDRYQRRAGAKVPALFPTHVLVRPRYQLEGS